MLYATDNNDYVPGDDFGKGYFFASMLAPYVGSVTIPDNKVYDGIYLHTNYSRIGVYRCPSFVSTKAGNTTPYTLQLYHQFDRFCRLCGHETIQTRSVSETIESPGLLEQAGLFL